MVGEVYSMNGEDERVPLMTSLDAAFEVSPKSSY